MNRKKTIFGLFVVGIAVLVLVLLVFLPKDEVHIGHVSCDFVYKVGQVMYHDLAAFVEQVVVEHTLKVVDSGGNETCLYRFDDSSLYQTQEEVLDEYMVEK